MQWEEVEKLKHQYGESGLTAVELQSVELGDDEELAAVLLEGQVAEPLEDLGHLQCTPVRGNTEELLEIHTSSFSCSMQLHATNLRNPDPTRIPAMLSRATPVLTMLGSWTTPRRTTVRSSPGGEGWRRSWRINRLKIFSPQATTSTEDRSSFILNEGKMMEQHEV